MVTRAGLDRLSPAARNSYSLATVLIEQGHWAEPVGSLRATVAEHPAFAPAQGRLSQCLAMMALLDPLGRQAAVSEAHLVALLALKLDAAQPDALLALTMLGSQPA